MAQHVVGKDHWMLRSIWKIIDFMLVIKELVASIPSFAISAWAYWGGLMDGLPPILQIIIILAIFSFTTLGMAGIMVFVEEYANRRGRKKDMRDAADRLQEMLDTGTESLPIGEVARIWSDENADKIYVFNPRLRRIKQAVREGKIKRKGGIIITQTVTSTAFQNSEGGTRLIDAGDIKSKPNMNTPVMLDSVIEALRKGKF